TDPPTKLLPVRVTVKAAPPAATVVGEIAVNAGTGLFTVKVRDALVPLPGVFTVMDRDPAAARSAALRVAVSCVLLTKVGLRLARWTWTVDALAKFAPVAVSVTGPLPATGEVGEMAVRVGLAGLVAVIVRFWAFEVQPPPSEFATVNACCPACARSLPLS